MVLVIQQTIKEFRLQECKYMSLFSFLKTITKKEKRNNNDNKQVTLPLAVLNTCPWIKFQFASYFFVKTLNEKENLKFIMLQIRK